MRKEEFAKIVKMHTLYRGDCESAKASGEIPGAFCVTNINEPRTNSGEKTGIGDFRVGISVSNSM